MFGVQMKNTNPVRKWFACWRSTIRAKRGLRRIKREQYREQSNRALETFIQRRHAMKSLGLSAGVGVGALALLAQTQRASADTPFSTFSFPATGGSASRTMPDRLSDYINVLDFGADRTGVNDSTAAIQAAVNKNISVSANSAALGTIYIPRGTYKITSPIFLPPGRDSTGATVVTMDIASPGTVNWTAHGLAPNTPVAFNFGPGGGTLPGGVGQVITNYVKTVISANQFTISATPGGAAINFTGSTSPTLYGTASTVLGVNQFSIVGDGPGATVLTGNVNGFIFDSGNIVTSSAHAFGYLISGMSFINNNTTQLSTGCVRVGGMLGTRLEFLGLSGMVGITTEDSPGNIYNGSQCYTIEHCYHSGGANTIGFVLTGDSHVLLSCDVSGALVGATLCGSGHQVLACHFEVNGTAVKVGIFGDNSTAGYVRGFLISAGAYEGNGTSIDFFNGCGYGLVQGPVIQGESAHSSAYGIRFRDSKCVRVTIQGAQIGGDMSVAGIYLGETTGGAIRAGNVIRGVESLLIGGAMGSAWVFPNVAHCAAGYTIESSCNAAPSWTFSNLPLTSDLLEGDKFYIVDANQATLGGVVTAGGSPNTHGWVVWNGTALTLMSK